MVANSPGGARGAGEPGLRWLPVTACLLVLAGLIGAFSLFAWRSAVDRRLDAGWRRSQGGGSFLERYPATGDNATVRDLETLAAAIGIGMGSPDTPGRGEPAAADAARFEAVKAPLKDFFSNQRIATEGALAPPPRELAAFLAAARPGLDSVRSRLAAGPVPVWKRDLESGLATRIPNYLGLLMLQKLLLLDASERLRAGDEAQAQEVLEASWRLNQAMSDNSPSLIAQIMGQAVIRLQQPILRRFSRAPAGWRERLLHLDLQARTLRSFQCEAFAAHRSASRDRPIAGLPGGPAAQFLARWTLWDYSRRFSAMIERLRRRDVRSFDPAAFHREQLASIPRWQAAARLLLPDFWDRWPRSAHVELEAELTALVLEERERLAAGGVPRAAGRSSRVAGLSWIYQDLPGATTVRLDGDLHYRDPGLAPLRFTVRPF